MIFMNFKDFMKDLNKKPEELDEEIDNMDLDELDENVVKLAQRIADVNIILQNNMLKNIVNNKKDRTGEILNSYTALLDAKSVLEEEIKKLESAKSKIDNKLKLVEYYLKTY